MTERPRSALPPESREANAANLGCFVGGVPLVAALIISLVSLWPGIVRASSFCCLPLGWLALVAGTVVWIWAVLASCRSSRIADRMAWAALIILVLCWMRVPLRGAFLLCHAEFEHHLDAAPSSPGQADPQHITIYRVHAHARDPRGGVYFCVTQGADWIDTVSGGFAWRPNDEGTPFGNAHYVRSHLFGDWWAFTVTDDW